ncbi:hypothetical protein FMM80_24690 [Schaedlerella arabinosiphila]|uniref:Uncharacterized protein n=1 Tax=Schaedlerella arabinosiphila TaxID=2044587 RepID=A0A9X5CBL7_9FIRM|nr:hypothetical protein [Schaedlerella arabinosiphila]KAI4443597.1 hypothetical protein C824_006133 [Schaedlerella arabinosiphila]NDO71674.1 hypothetical protein [Schaedlerella arabinosiphila]
MAKMMDAYLKYAKSKGVSFRINIENNQQQSAMEPIVIEQAVEAQKESEWDLDDIIDKETFMNFDFPYRYGHQSNTTGSRVSLLCTEAMTKVGIDPTNVDDFLMSSSKIKKYASLGAALGGEKWEGYYRNRLEEERRSGLRYMLKWMGLYSTIYHEYVILKKEAYKVILENIIIGEDVIRTIINLIDEEQKAGFGRLDQFVIDLIEEQGEQNAKEIDNTRNLLNIMERHLSNKLTPQDIADLKENAQDWEKDIEKLSAMLEDLSALDLEQAVSGK